MKSLALEAWTMVTLAALLGLAVNQVRGLPLLPLGPFDKEPEAAQVHRLDPREALGLLGKAVFLDVRTLGQYRSGHIPGARFQSRIQPVDPFISRDAPVVVYCARGCLASLHVAEAMVSHGFHRVEVLQDGWEGWCAQGGPQKPGQDP